MYYENLLRVHHTLLYTKEQVFHCWFMKTLFYLKKILMFYNAEMENKHDKNLTVSFIKL